jgi:hypothetical protein
VAAVASAITHDGHGGARDVRNQSELPPKRSS